MDGEGFGRDLPVVVVGASAGGLEALRAFFRSDVDFPDAVFVVVQHLAPDHKSMMVDILQRETNMPVSVAEVGMFAKTRHVYLNSARTDLSIDGSGCFNLRPALDPFRPIDTILHSMASRSRGTSIAVILSGSGSDGSQGIYSVKENSGIVIAQDPASADFTSMPLSAVRTGLCDLVCKPAAMMRAIAGFVRQLSAPLIQEEDALQRVFELVRDTLEIDFTQYKRGTGQRRVARRMSLLNIPTVADYFAHLKSDADEQNQLVRDLLIGVTRFFRDGDVWSSLGEKLPELIDGASGDRVRVWTAGCSTGEEAYTVAMLLHEAFESLGIEPDFQILATDLHREALDVARRAIYPAERVQQEAGHERLERFFVPVDEGAKIAPFLRERVVFSVHDLLRDPHFSGCHLATCRNVLIYFQSVAQRRAVGQLFHALLPGGLLLLGSSEHPPAEDAFRTALTPLSGVRHGYVAQSGVRLKTHPPTFSPVASRTLAGWNRKPPDVPFDALRVLADTDGVGLALVDGQHRLTHTFGPFLEMLELAEGRFSQNLMELCSGALRVALSNALNRAEHTGKPAVFHDVRTPSGPLSVDAIPFPETGFLVRLTRRRQAPEQVIATGEDADAALVAQVEYYREHLRSTLQELESRAEEMQASNEELIASNEELQSTNEELQSLNEELHTVNSELSDKNAELLQLNKDFDGLVSNLPAGVIFLDDDLRIRKFNRAAQGFLPLRPADVGRPLFELGGLREVARLRELCDQTRTTGEKTSMVVRRADGHWYRASIHPFEGAGNHKSPRRALLILFDDIHDEYSRSLEFGAIFDNVPLGLLSMDRDFVVRSINRYSAAQFGKTPEDMVGRGLFDVVPGMNARMPIYQRVLAGEAVESLAEYVPQLERFYDVHYLPTGAPDSETFGMLVAARDVTAEITRIRRLIPGAQRFERLSRRLKLAGIELTDSMMSASEETLWCAFTGLGSDEVRERGWLDGFHAEDRARVLEFLHHPNRHEQQTTARLWSADERAYVDVDLVTYAVDPSVPSPGDIGLLAVSAEARRSMRQLQRSNEDLEQFAYVASHDLRQPLRMVYQFAQILKQGETDLSEDGHVHLDFLMKSAARANRLVTGLLQYSRLQHAERRPEPVELTEVVRGAATEHAPATVVPELPVIEGYRGQLEQCFVNLFSNARVHGGPDVEVSVAVLKDDAIGVSIAIDDSGPGVPVDFREKAFNLFQRLDPDKPGVGIGLSMIRRVVAGHGGTIEIDDSPLGGARFIVHLPKRVDESS